MTLLTSPLITVTGNTLTFDGNSYRCAVGRSGISHKQREGDGITPVGTFALRECWWRADRIHREPDTELAVLQICEEDGWCDAPEHPSYNRHVILPFPASHELLWRKDHQYNLVVPLSYNDSPIKAGVGSAIFMHVATPDYSPTEGCIALSQADLLELLDNISADTQINIQG